VISEPQHPLVEHTVGGASNIVGGILNFFGNIPRSVPHPFRAKERLDIMESLDTSESNIEEKTANNSDNSGILQQNKNKESKDETRPNLIRFGLRAVDETVDSGSKIVGGVFNFFGNIPKLLPRPTISVQRIEEKDSIEVRNGRVQEDEVVLANSWSSSKQVNNYCGVEAPASGLVEVLANISHFSRFVDLIEFADVNEDLTRENGVTVLAPNNAAIDKLEDDVVEKLFGDPKLAKKTILSQVLDEVLCCTDITRNNGIFFNSSRRQSITGSRISFRKTASGNLYADKSQLEKVSCDRVFQYGVIHEVDRLL